MPSSDTAAIQALNDQFRRTGIGGRVLLSLEMQALPFWEQAAIINAVQTFEAFTADNDPHGEHDFGSVDHHGQTIFFKIDYFDTALEYGSENPADPAQTTRVLTIMFASEY